MGPMSLGCSRPSRTLVLLITLPCVVAMAAAPRLALASHDGRFLRGCLRSSRHSATVRDRHVICATPNSRTGAFNHTR